MARISFDVKKLGKRNGQNGQIQKGTLSEGEEMNPCTCFFLLRFFWGGPHPIFRCNAGSRAPSCFQVCCLKTKSNQTTTSQTFQEPKIPKEPTVLSFGFLVWRDPTKKRNMAGNSRASSAGLGRKCHST